MLFRKLRTRAAERKALPELIPPDPAEASAALDQAVDAHMAAQQQLQAAKRVATELRTVNDRNGFAPAIVATVTKRYGGPSGASA